MKRNERNNPELRPEETVDQLESTALDTEALQSKEQTERAEEPDTGTEPAFDQDLDVEDLPGQAGQGSSSASEPTG